MLLTVETIAKDDVLEFWYDTGAFGAQVCFARVLKVGPKKVKVRDECGRVAWKYPHFFFDKATPEAVKNLIEEGVKIGTQDGDL